MHMAVFDRVPVVSINLVTEQASPAYARADVTPSKLTVVTYMYAWGNQTTSLSASLTPPAERSRAMGLLIIHESMVSCPKSKVTGTTSCIQNLIRQVGQEV